MNICVIYLFNEFNMSMLTAINLNVVKLMIKTLLFKIKEDSVNLLH